jgi:glyoxylase-like metal-dependent hydrolase (beta-lactamase superfamily II)
MTGPLTVEEVLPDVWRLQVPLAFLEPPEVSIYLLRTSEGDVLIDAGMPGSEDAVDEALRSAGSSRSRIVETVVTHEHPDHLGLAVWVGAPIAMHPLTRQLLDLFVNADPGRYSRLLDRYWLQPEDIPDAGMFDMFRAMLSIPDDSRDINDGDVIAGGWTALWTPGHSPGHLCLYHEGHRALIAGDHVLPGYTPHVGMDPFHEDPVGAFIDSLLRVATYACDLVLPGHGEPFADLQAGVDSLTQHHARRLQRIEEAVLHPRTVREVTDEVFRSHESPIDSIMAVIEAGAHLLHLELIGKASRIDGRRWVARRDAHVKKPEMIRDRRGSR